MPVMAPRKKKPYRKPSVETTVVYETKALACMKMPGQAGCAPTQAS